MKKALIALAAMAVSTGALAGPSWTYVDLGLVVADGSNDEDTTGAALRGSFGFADLWHIQASVAGFEEAGGKSKGGADITAYELRGGIHPAVTDNADFVLDIGYLGAEEKTEDGGSQKLKPSSYDIRAGYRQDIGNLELRGFIKYARTDNDAEGEASEKVWNLIPSLGLQYNFSDAWSLGADYVIEDDNLTNIYVRWSF